jgi:hypothetical protein
MSLLAHTPENQIRGECANYSGKVNVKVYIETYKREVVIIVYPCLCEHEVS